MWGAVARDRNDSVLAACSVRVTGSFSVHVAECLAVKEGTRLAALCGHRKWVIESDAINVVRSVMKPAARAPEAFDCE